MNIVESNHRDAVDAIPAADIKMVRSVLSNLQASIGTNGQSKVRVAIVKDLLAKGWSEPVRVSPDLNITVTGMKGRTALCVQFGNVGRFYADLLKLQLLYNMGSCDGAIYVALTKSAAGAAASNLTYLERMVKELKEFRGIINVPIKLLGVE